MHKYRIAIGHTWPVQNSFVKSSCVRTQGRQPLALTGSRVLIRQGCQLQETTYMSVTGVLESQALRATEEPAQGFSTWHTLMRSADTCASVNQVPWSPVTLASG